ncbi:2002_t:CDS:1, partial [Funneliformis mosseae]
NKAIFSWAKEYNKITKTESDDNIIQYITFFNSLDNKNLCEIGVYLCTGFCLL